jgi:hypothetical protein
MASLDDILTTQKNGVTGINGVQQSNLRGQGTATSSTVTASTLIIAGNGYLVSYSVVVKGSVDGFIYNSSTVAGIAASNALCNTDKTTAGVYKVGLVFNQGLVIAPGTGQSINVTYFVG